MLEFSTSVSQEPFRCPFPDGEAMRRACQCRGERGRKIPLSDRKPVVTTESSSDGKKKIPKFISATSIARAELVLWFFSLYSSEHSMRNSGFPGRLLPGFCGKGLYWVKEFLFMPVGQGFLCFSSAFSLLSLTCFSFRFHFPFNICGRNVKSKGLELQWVPKKMKVPILP